MTKKSRVTFSEKLVPVWYGTESQFLYEYVPYMVVNRNNVERGKGVVFFKRQSGKKIIQPRTWVIPLAEKNHYQIP